MKAFRLVVFVVAFSFCLAHSAAGTVTFDFDNCTPILTPGMSTPLNQTCSGILGHFSSTHDGYLGGGYSIQTDGTTGYHLSQFSSNYLWPNGLDPGRLDISLNQSVTTITFTFATADSQIEVPTTIQMDAYLGSTLVGSMQAHGTYGSDTFPMGTLSYDSGGRPFDRIEIWIPPASGASSDVLVDNIILGGTQGYTLTVSPSGNGTVTSTDGFISCPGTCSYSYPANTQVTLNATPATGWIFSGWSGACSGTGACVVTMTQSLSVGATFTQSGYTLTVSTSGDGTVTSTDGFISCPGTCSHSYPGNTQVTLNATPGMGWTFVAWTGACSGGGSCMVTMTQSWSVHAIFAGSGALQFVPLTPPCRAVDTRPEKGGGGPIQTGTHQDFAISGAGSCGVLASAAAYSLNVSVVPAGPLGYLTVWPAGQPQPLASTLTSMDGRIKANAAIVPAGASGPISVYASNTTNVIVDVNGYFAPVSSSTLAFYPLTPCRVADTRTSSYPQDLGPPFLNGGQERAFPILNATNCNIPSGVAAYSLNFSVVPHGALFYMTVWPTGETQPLVSTLSDIPGTVIANAAIVVAGTAGKVSVYPTNDTDLVIDINGYFAAAGTGGLSLYGVQPCRVIDTRHTGSGLPFSGALSPPVDVVGSPCGISSLAQAYVFNASVVPQRYLGYLTLWPDGTNQPLVSTLNALDGSISSNMAIVPSTNGKVDAYASGITQLILDISSYFAP